MRIHSIHRLFTGTAGLLLVWGCGGGVPFRGQPVLEVYDIGADYVLGRSRDDFDVEYIQRWTLTR